MAASFVAFLLYLTQPEGSGENPSPDDASAASAGKTGVNGAEEEEEANWEEASRRVREQQARALLAAPDPLTAALAIPVRQLAAVDSKRMAAVPVTAQPLLGLSSKEVVKKGIGSRTRPRQDIMQLAVATGVGGTGGGGKGGVDGGLVGGGKGGVEVGGRRGGGDGRSASGPLAASTRAAAGAVAAAAGGNIQDETLIPVAIIPSQSLSCADTLPPAPVPLSTAVSAAPASATAGGDGEGERGALGGHTRTGGSLGYLSPLNKGAAVTTNSGAAGDLINGPDLASGGTPDRGAEKGRRPERIQRSVSDTAAISAGSTAGGAAFSAARTGGGAGGGTRGEGGGGGIGGVGVKVEVAAERAVSPVAPQPMIYEVKVDLLAAKNLPAANISGTADPYAIVSCGTERRFSSVIPSSRNPMWAEEFRFFAPCLPALVSVRTYDWDIISKNAELGAASLLVEGEALPFTAWYPLDKGMGQVCLQLQVTAVPRNKADSTAAKGAAISSSRLRRLSQQPTSAGAGDKQEGEAFEGERPEQQQQEQEAGRGTEVRLKPGPLQTIFGLPPDEVIRHSFSCALERSFLYHGRMFLSGAHLCFHSNVFSKELTVCIPYQDIEEVRWWAGGEVRRSTHALINPAMTVVLHLGTGGHGVPPLPSPDAMAVVLHLGTGGHGVPPLPSPDAMTAVLHLGTGGRGRGATSSQPSRVKYKFASFWNRGHAMPCGSLATSPHSPPIALCLRPPPSLTTLLAGRVKYKFASFWNRGHAMRLLQEAIAEFWKTEEAAALVRSLCPWCPARCAHHHRLSCLLGSRQCLLLQEAIAEFWKTEEAAALEEEQDRLRAISMRDGALEGLSFRGAALEAAEEEKEKQPFLDLTVLEHLLQFEVPCTAETYFNLLYSDSSDFVVVYRAKRKDTELKVGEWKETEQYGGKMREPPCLHSTPSLPHSPFSTAMTDCGTRDFMLCLPRTHPSFSRPACTAPPLSPTPLSPLPWPIGGVWSGTQDFMLCLPRTHPSFSRHACTLSPTPRLPCAPTQVTYRSLCDSPMCPPSTAMTEWQHTAFSAPDHKHLVLELINQAHDVPFGSYFEVHAQWTVKTTSDNPESPSCSAELKAGVHFKKWCMMQGKIRQGAQAEMKRNSQAMMEMAMTYIAERTQGGNQPANCNAAGSVGADSSDSNGRGNGGDVKVEEGGEAGGVEGRENLVPGGDSRRQGSVDTKPGCYLGETVCRTLLEKGQLGLSLQDLARFTTLPLMQPFFLPLLPIPPTPSYQTVCRTLLEKGQLGLSLQDLTRFTALPPPSLRSALLVLVQHNCAQAFRPQTEDTGPLARTPTLYIALQDSILPRLRFPKFMAQTNELLGDEHYVQAEAVVEALLGDHSHLSRPQLVKQPKFPQCVILPFLPAPPLPLPTHLPSGKRKAEAVVEALLEHGRLFPCRISPPPLSPLFPFPIQHTPRQAEAVVEALLEHGRLFPCRIFWSTAAMPHLLEHGRHAASFGARPPCRIFWSTAAWHSNQSSLNAPSSLYSPCPRPTQHTSHQAEAVVEALLEHGRLSLHQLVQRSVAKAGSSDPSAAKTEGQVRQQLVAALSVLIHERLVERVGAPEPMLPARGASSGGDAPKPAARARVRAIATHLLPPAVFSMCRLLTCPTLSAHSGNDGVVGPPCLTPPSQRMRAMMEWSDYRMRATMESSGYFDSEEHRVRTRAMMESSGYFDSEEHRVVIAARCSDALRFQLPAAWVLSGGDGAGGNAVSAAAVDGSAGADGGMSAAAAAKLKLPAAWVLSGGGGAGGGAASAAAVDGSTGADGGMSAAAAAKLKVIIRIVVIVLALVLLVVLWMGAQGRMGKRVVLDADDAEEEQAGPSAKRQALAALHHTVFPISALAPHPTAPPLQRKRVVLDDDDEEEQAGPSAKRPALRKRVVLDDDDEEEQAGPSAKRLATGAAPHNRKRVVLDDDDDEEQAGPSAKRPATGAAAGGGEKQGGGGEDSGVLWRVNYEEFLRRTRHQTIVDFVRESIDPGASIITAALLHAGKNQETSLRHPYSASLSLDSIVNAVEAIVSQRFGPSACRLFRLLLSKNCLEQKQAAELAMISLADARQLLYRMMLDEFVQLQRIMPLRGHSTSRTFTSQRFCPACILHPTSNGSAPRAFFTPPAAVLPCVHSSPHQQRFCLACILHPTSSGSALRAFFTPPAAVLPCVHSSPHQQRFWHIHITTVLPLAVLPLAVLVPLEVPKTADHAPQRTFYLWRIHIGTVLPRVLNHMCHGACNLRLRLEHEMQQEQEVLSLLEQIEQAHAAHSTGGAASSAGGDGGVLSLLEQIEQAHAAHSTGGAASSVGGGGGAPEKAVALTSGQRKQLERIRRVLSLLEQIEQAHAAHSTGGAASSAGGGGGAPEKAVALTSGQRKQLERIRRVRSGVPFSGGGAAGERRAEEAAGEYSGVAVVLL
ncbi:unnamed protein product [Closterium sp. NIES-65]|nr:unnamed protein product [Closterium sp. NIES-65]